MQQQQISKFKTIRKQTISCIGVVLFLSVLFGVYTPVSALTISPARIEISGDPGATVGGEFTLINEQSTPQTFYASYENFTAQGETGVPAFSSEKIGLDTWLSVGTPQITIAPGDIVKIPYTITIPKDAEPGGYFAAIFWSTTPPTGNSIQVSIGAKVGLLVLLRVNGAITEQAGLTLFDRNSHGFFYTTLPVDFRYKFRNDGSDRVEPTGTLTIRDTVFLPAKRLDANPTNGNILPKSVRQFTLEWLQQKASIPVEGFFDAVGYEWHNFALGLYSAHLELVYGSLGVHAGKTIWFFVFPWQLVICLVLGIGIVWKGGKTLLSRYNRYIISQAQAAMQPREKDRS